MIWPEMNLPDVEIANPEKSSEASPKCFPIRPEIVRPSSLVSYTKEMYNFSLGSNTCGYINR